jgi:glycosyltransferase involved in cell wall biosynthesis
VKFWLGLGRRAWRAARWTVNGELPQRLRERRSAQSYDRWVRDYDSLDDSDRAAIREHIGELQWPVLISVVVPVYNTDPRHLREMIESVRRQLYPRWELCIADDASTEPHATEVLRELAAHDSRIKVITRQTNGHISAATNSALDLASGEFVALLDHDDLLPEHALYEVAVELNAHPDADVVYSDSDFVDDAGLRSNPYFKPGWDPDLMLGQNLVSHLGVYRRSLVDEIGRLRLGFEGSQDYDLMLRAAAVTTPDRIRHVPAILYHWRRAGRQASFAETSLERCAEAARRAIREHLEHAGIRARVEPAPGTTSFHRVVYPLPSPRPLVSIIVPTRDRGDLLAGCVDGVLTRTDYEPLEVIVVDNESQERETLQLFSRLAADPRVRVIPYTGRFNYAAINNMAVREARGDVVVLLNNDVSVISGGWLREMVSQALRPEVGAVGAKLLHADGRIQHGGIVIGGDHGAGHLFQQLPREDPGPFALLALTRRVSAVTAACMALRRAVYLAAGGMDEVNLPVAYNDVDLCLRLGEQGYAVIWTPYAELYHLESASRGPDTIGEAAARLEHESSYLRRRWASAIAGDPHYNPNCSLVVAAFQLAFPPRRAKPWVRFKRAPAPVAATR